MSATPRDRWVIVGLIVLAGIICAIGLAFGSTNEFAGTDSRATDEISTVAPDYQPWFKPIFTPGSGEIESGLFGVQAGIGGLIVGYTVATLRNRTKLRELQARYAAAPSAAEPPAGDA